MKNFKKLFLSALTAGIVLLNSSAAYAVGWEKLDSAESRSNSTEKAGGLGYFVIERASGETEEYYLETSEAGFSS